MFGFRTIRENGGKFKIDQAEAPVGLPVGDVAHFRIVMAHAVGLQLGEEFLASRLVQMVYAAAATGGHHAKLRGISFEQSGHEWTPPGFEMAKHTHLVLEALLGLGAAKDFMDATIPADPDERPESVFDLIHDWKNMARFDKECASFSIKVARFILLTRLACCLL
jgi:hypothetical protein